MKSAEESADNEFCVWKRHWEFLVSACALGWGLPNVVRLPSVAFQNGHGNEFQERSNACQPGDSLYCLLLFSSLGVFLVIWILLMFLIGLPMLFLEVSLAYFSNRGPYYVWKAVPLFKGDLSVFHLS